jgi:hypothetical protein
LKVWTLLEAQLANPLWILHEVETQDMLEQGARCLLACGGSRALAAYTSHAHL